MLPTIEGAAARLRREGASHVGKAKQRLLHLAVVGTGEGGRSRIARLVIHQDGGDHGLHIAAYSLAVVLENRGHPLQIRWAGVAGDQMLDQLLGNEDRGIGVVEQGVEGDLQVAVRVGGTCRYQSPPENPFRRWSGEWDRSTMGSKILANAGPGIDCAVAGPRLFAGVAAHVPAEAGKDLWPCPPRR